MEEIVRKHFKKIKRKDKIQEIIANVKAVILDQVKPSFLFDICGCDGFVLSNFVNEVNSRTDLGTKSNIICIDDCHNFIANLDKVQEAIENALSNKLVIIDTGKEAPIIHNEVSRTFREMLSSIVEKLQSNT